MTGPLPPIRVINLERDALRLARFRARNAHLSAFERLSAQEGRHLDRAALAAAGHILPELRYAPGTLGCAMSHLAAWQLAATTASGLTVFEDDTVTVRDFEAKASAVLAAVPEDWDVINWGMTLNPLSGWIDLGATLARIDCFGARRFEGTAGITAFQAQDLRPAAFRLRHAFGLVGYSVSAKGAAAMVKLIRPLTNAPINDPETGFNFWNEGIDTALCRHYGALKAYVCLPGLCQSFDDQVSTRVSGDLGAGECRPIS